MSPAKKATEEPGTDLPRALVVATRFAYAALKTGEVRQQVRGDVLDPALYKPESLDHLKSIGFLAEV